MPNETTMLGQLGIQPKNETNPNINNNQLPEHGNPTIGAIFEEEYLEEEVEKIRIPIVHLQTASTTKDDSDQGILGELSWRY
ncbi:hypothetical protein CR513_26644, partial [Mucuna pruriens]